MDFKAGKGGCSPAGDTRCAELLYQMPFDRNNIVQIIDYLNGWALPQKNVASCLSRLRFTG